MKSRRLVTLEQNRGEAGGTGLAVEEALVSEYSNIQQLEGKSDSACLFLEYQQQHIFIFVNKYYLQTKTQTLLLRYNPLNTTTAEIAPYPFIEKGRIVPAHKKPPPARRAVPARTTRLYPRDGGSTPTTPYTRPSAYVRRRPKKKMT